MSLLRSFDRQSSRLACIQSKEMKVRLGSHLPDARGQWRIPRTSGRHHWSQRDKRCWRGPQQAEKGRPKALDHSWDLINFPSGSSAQTEHRATVLRTGVIKQCLSWGGLARNVSTCHSGLSPQHGGNEKWETGTRNTVEKESPGGQGGSNELTL